MNMTVKNQYGQHMGRKGHLTRERILTVAGELLRERSLEKLRVSDITRAAKLAPATFYLYFNDVYDCVLAVIAECCKGLTDVSRLLDEEWTPENIYKKAHRLVSAFFSFWGQNASLLSVRNLVCDAGDERFIQQKLDTSMPFLMGFARKIEEFQDGSNLPRGATPYTIACILMAGLERTVAARSSGVYERSQSTDGMVNAPTEDLINAQAYVIAISVLGRQVPIELMAEVYDTEDVLV